MLVDSARCVLLQKRCGFGGGGFNNIRRSLNIQGSGGIFCSRKQMIMMRMMLMMRMLMMMDAFRQFRHTMDAS